MPTNSTTTCFPTSTLTVVHSPHVALITRAQVMTDKIPARTLANLHAVGLLPSVWIPPLDVRDHRALVAQRAKMVRLSTQAKNLVGYAGLGARVHDSGQTHHTGHITRAGRSDIRAAMIKVAHTAARTHPYSRAEPARLEPPLGKNKAIAAEIHYPSGLLRCKSPVSIRLCLPPARFFRKVHHNALRHRTHRVLHKFRAAYAVKSNDKVR